MEVTPFAVCPPRERPTYYEKNRRQGRDHGTRTSSSNLARGGRR